MKKFTYEVTIEAEHQDDADTRMKGLSLFTQTPVVKQEPLSKEEEAILALFRHGNPLAKLSMMAAGAFFHDISFPKHNEEEVQL